VDKSVHFAEESNFPDPLEARNGIYEQQYYPFVVE
jgi:hypothetical protein